MAPGNEAPKKSFVRRAGAAIVRAPGTGVLLAVPRTASFAVGAWRKSSNGNGSVDGDTPPAPKLSAALAAQVALDELLLGMMKSPKRFPSEGDYVRMAEELQDALRLYGERGWLDDPLAYHREPPPLRTPIVKRGWAYGLPFERVSWASEFEPVAGEPGGAEWRAYAANARAHAWIVRAADPHAPWLICVHGFGVGVPTADFFAFRAKRLSQELGVNLLFPVLPLHGPRKNGRIGGAEMLSHRLHHFVLGMAQAVWDARRIIGWLRDHHAPSVGIYGMSLGSYVAALLAALDPDLDLVLLGAPVCDIPDLMRHHSPAGVLKRAQDAGIETGVMQQAFRVVSPLAVKPRVPRERLYVYAGLGDRMATPEQARRMWEHWDRPNIEWYEGSHIAFLWSGAVARFIDDALARSLLITVPKTP
jgi:dienelactone hydrolase